MNHPPLSKPAAIYARQSRSSRTELTSCEAQVDICELAAAAHGWNLTRPYVDEVESSETLDRPAIQELLAEIKTGTITRLVVDRLDRLTRRLVDLLVLLELFADYQVELVVVNDPNFNHSATSRLMTHIVGAASEFQFDITRERLADARAASTTELKRYPASTIRSSTKKFLTRCNGRSRHDKLAASRPANGRPILRVTYRCCGAS